eukprot:CAMPEP_0182419644 /NCGR_PEP_ID=MMETSP1167-20130531/4054_1 /TAXON_ID=2988 /ORGANISM="Mallomonas Sp, Strain CCMP3275" /LENGTH=337 /DNA_ID=CAMNT_0024594673 /DNA_START=119 /DNA_END=1133 /DNA_ORIENTATION=-
MFPDIQLQIQIKQGHLSKNPTSLSSTKNPFNFEVSPDIALSTDISELPNSFDDSIARAAKRTLDCIAYGKKLCRIDFDTTVGDMTFTSLKNTLPLVKSLVNIISTELDLYPLYPSNTTLEENSNITTEEVVALLKPPKTERTMTIFFPDMGAAALARRDWKMNTNEAEVPYCVRTASIANDPLLKTDKMSIILCPQPSEVDYVQRVLDEARDMNIPCIVINPLLINMDQGFGVRARNIRKNLLASLETTYKLKTMATGAIVREWPRGYSVWAEDDQQEEGYTHLQSFKTDPPSETVMELYDAHEEATQPSPVRKEGPNPAVGVVKGVVGFFQGLSKL